MPVTKITLSTAMRARDVSRPHEQHLAEAAVRENTVRENTGARTRAGRAPGGGAAAEADAGAFAGAPAREAQASGAGADADPAATAPGPLAAPDPREPQLSRGSEPQLFVSEGGPETIAVFAIRPARADSRGVRGVVPPGDNSGGSSAVFSKSAIMARRRACLGSPENGVSTKTFANDTPSSVLYSRAPRLSTFASLCSRASRAVSSVQASAARMPGTLLAAICSPLPEPPITIPRLPGSRMVPCAARST